MKRFFLIPLLTLLTCVMAWGTEIEVDNFADLKTQLSADGTADVVKLKNDIPYEGTEVLNIERSLTLDGQGYKITGTGNCNSRIDNVEIKNQPTSIAIDAERNKTNLVVIIKNLDLDKPTPSGSRYYGIMALDGAKELTLENVHINNTPGGNAQGFCAQGANTELMKVTIRNSTISGGAGYGYATYILRPLDLKIYNSTIEGYCTLYFKGPQGLLHDMNPAPHYGSGNAGARGTEVYAENTYFNATNKGNGGSNDFGNIVFEDDGISLELVNCGMDAQALGNAVQDVFLLNGFYFPIEERAHQAITVSISGDNSHINGNIVCNQWYGKYKYVNSKNSWIAENGVSMKDQNFNKIGSYDANGSWNYGDKDIDITITGGTYAVNPKEYKFNTHINTSDASYVDPSTLSSGASYPIHTDARVPKYTKGLIIDTDIYEVKTLSQGGTTVYRVVKRAAEETPGVLYDLNANVESAGNGQNPVTSFDLKTGGEMSLNQETTKAGYVLVENSDASVATTVKVGKTEGSAKVDQTLVVNNGLDVSGTSVVDVQAGSSVVIGEGGIVTAAPANIVLNADKDGCASLLLDPTITVNKTPNLTVKMTAQGVGKIGENYFWHRFALPVDHVQAGDGSWAKEGHTYDTYLYKWDYTNNEWASLQELSEMQPFYGYTLSIEESCADPAALKNPVYVFKGNLTGNVNSALNFSRQGYNFFGNSYTGYISILQLVNELIGNNDLDATVWMWNTKGQRYEGIPLNDLKNNPTAPRYNNSNSWKKEVAPMQTFILRLMTENTDATANINYATAVWGNPRYSSATGVSAAPARRVASTNDAYVRVIVAAENGQEDAVNFYEDANLSDAYDRGYDASKYMDANAINVYATVNGENYGTVATDNIEGKKFTIQTNSAMNYTLSFEDIEGEYALRDNVTGQVIAIEEGATYEFTAQPNSVVENRFEIVNVNKMPTAIENTEVKANVKGIYTIMGQYLGEDFDILPAGVYVVNGVKIVK